MQSKREGVLLFHPGCGSFIQQVGRALYDGRLLIGFRTTLNYLPDSRLWRSARLLSNFVGFDIGRVLANRRITELPQSLVITNGWREFLRALVNRFDKDGRIADALWEWSELAFDKWVAKGLDPNLSAVYGYEHASLSTFQCAKNLGIACIYELPAPEPAFVHSILQQEYAKFPELHSPYHQRLNRLLERRNLRRRQEGELADLVIVNSSLTRDSYVAAGLDPAKIRVIPLGAPPVTERFVRSKISAPLRFIWAGTFSVRKGAHCLLEAWRKSGLDSQSTVLDIYGSVTLPQRLIEDLPKNIRLHGPCPQKELFDHFLQADLLVLPTLCDGFGMVITEAMAHGLPVLTTSNAGAAELIRDGENGMLVPVGDVDALVLALKNCVNNRQTLSAMGESARVTAANWQWVDFRAALLNEVENFLALRGTA